MNNAIYPCLILKGHVREASQLYADAFGAKIIQSYPMVNMLELDGQKLMLLDDGPPTKPTPAISFMVVHETAAGTEQCWKKLAAEGKALMELGSYPWSACYGWIEDKFGVSWQLITSQQDMAMQKFAPSIMFTGNNAGKAAAAIEFYTGLFPNASVRNVMKYNDDEGENPENIKHAQFLLNNYLLTAMDSSYEHGFGFTEGVSFVVECNTQEEIDNYWNKLSGDGGKELVCGWVADKYGINWQITPASLGSLMKDPERAKRVLNEVFKMKKLIIKDLENA